MVTAILNVAFDRHLSKGSCSITLPLIISHHKEKDLVSLTAATVLFALNAVGKSGADPRKMVTVLR